MQRPLRFVLLALLALSATALAACGGADEREAKNAYVRGVNAAQNEFASNVSTVSGEITATSSSDEDRRTLERFETAIQDVVRKLRAIEVPDDVQTEHEQLTAAMGGFGDDIKEATTALRNPTTRAIAEAQRTIAMATQTVNGRIDSAIAAINSKLGSEQ
ncbi:MAG: hypothetical protein Q8O56_15835 [Solirubrobacteraceae bacterium]|nr:hypothetical protein [Solirubrobacteraceae bacterium]